MDGFPTQLLAKLCCPIFSVGDVIVVFTQLLCKYNGQCGRVNELGRPGMPGLPKSLPWPPTSATHYFFAAKW